MEFNSSTGYRTFQKGVSDFLIEFGFKSYNSSTVYRVTEDCILQFISFQKGVQSLNHQMTINVVLQSLFCPTCSFNLIQPGGRIGNFLNNRSDKWWFCDTEEETTKSVVDTNKSIRAYILPFFDKTLSAKSVCDLIESKEYNFIWLNSYAFINKGFFYLKANIYDSALNIFLSNQPSKVPKFKTIKNSIDQHKYSDIDNILKENELHSKNKLKI